MNVVSVLLFQELNQCEQSEIFLFRPSNNSINVGLNFFNNGSDYMSFDPLLKKFKPIFLFFFVDAGGFWKLNSRMRRHGTYFIVWKGDSFITKEKVLDIFHTFKRVESTDF